MSWRDRAVCRAEDPDLFFPVSSAGPALRQLHRAKAVCGRCPVTADCLTWALSTGQQAGVWGGLSEDERRALRSHRAHRPPEATPHGRYAHPRSEQTTDLDHSSVIATILSEGRNTP
jgi:WhiB family transcriptional regulator, redox-sensing transcriptional regulator